MTVLFGASSTSIAIPRVKLAPPSPLSRTMMSPELLMVRMSVSAGAVPVHCLQQGCRLNWRRTARCDIAIGMTIDGDRRPVFLCHFMRSGRHIGQERWRTLRHVTVAWCRRQHRGGRPLAVATTLIETEFTIDPVIGTVLTAKSCRSCHPARPVPPQRPCVATARRTFIVPRDRAVLTNWLNSTHDIRIRTWDS